MPKQKSGKGKTFTHRGKNAASKTKQQKKDRQKKAQDIKQGKADKKAQLEAKNRANNW